MNFNKIVGGSLLLVLLFSVMVNVSLYQSQQKTAFVNLEQVFEEFKGKKELEAQFMSAQTQRNRLLDSISMDLQVLRVKFNEAPKKEEMLQELSQKQTVFAKLRNEFSSQEEQEDLEYSQKIWQQINQYTNDFGKENGYDFIHGTKSDGSLMYANQSIDITTILIQYINEKYEGL